jgi:enamine deaminase RidA (YjgF/YER057c/UK114 family)
MQSLVETRRKFTGRITALLAALTGGVAAASAAPPTVQAIQKLDASGHPASGKQMITPLIIHNGLIYISGQGANDNAAAASLDIATHAPKVLDNVKRLVEAGGGNMDSILQMTVYLATLADYEAMNQVFRTYFPNGGPARTTIAVAGVPGHSLLEINCIAAVVKAELDGRRTSWNSNASRIAAHSWPASG